MFGDDVGYWNVSAYNAARWDIGRRISTASPGTARSSPTRTRSRAARPAGRRSSRASRLSHGPHQVGLPGAPEGLSAKDPTLANLLKGQGYMTASSARTTSATAMSSSRRCTVRRVHGNFYHLNARRSQRTRTTRRAPSSRRVRSARRLQVRGDDHESTLRRPALRQMGQAEVRDTGPLT